MKTIHETVRRWCWLALFFISACATNPVQVDAPPASPKAQSPASTLEIIQTIPVETTLESFSLRSTHDAWLSLINEATERIDMAHFYTSNKAGSRLDKVIEALREAADRGIKIRFVVDGKFSEKYPDTLNALSAIPGLQLRIFHVEPVMGGILHAKYFLIDGQSAFLGSQNFDWRSLEHIHELGVIIKEPSAVRAIQAVFDTDWFLAAGAKKTPSMALAENFPAHATIGGEKVQITPVFSPKDWLPDPELWDLPRIVALIDNAKGQVQIQLLSFKTHGYHGEDFPTLSDALLRAAERGVQVQLLVSHWNTGTRNLPALRQLHAHPNLTVSVTTIPQWSGGAIPYARVIHAKYMVVDEKHSWIGTSNWGPGYFHESRNVGLIVDGAAFARPLTKIFTKLWAAAITQPLKVTGTYPRPTK